MEHRQRDGKKIAQNLLSGFAFLMFLIPLGCGGIAQDLLKQPPELHASTDYDQHHGEELVIFWEGVISDMKVSVEFVEPSPQLHPDYS